METDRIICGDCLVEMKAFPDSSINLILTDPPYFKVKGEAWDHQWNKLELAGKAILDDLKIDYQEQAPMFKKFLVDILIEDVKLVIQWDGNYWHCHPDYAPFSDRQTRRAKLDKSQDAYLKKAGYRVLRIWDSDVKKRPDWVKSQILEYVGGNNA